MKTPELPPNARITGPAREQLAKQLAARYHAGASIREICAQTGYSIGRVRGLLISVRQRGGARRRG